jgi:hypothetical protein
MSETEAISEAIQQVAKFGEKALETSEKIGGFFACVFKEPVIEIASMITDKLRFVRWKRLLTTVDEVNRILGQRGIHNTRAVPPKLALPIFEESSLEDDETLHSLWNCLLANAMDTAFQYEIRYAYVEIIKNLTSLDTRLLRYLYDKMEDPKEHYTKAVGFSGLSESDIISQSEVCASCGIATTDYVLSSNNLIRLRLIVPYAGWDIAKIVITPFGISFIEACME